MTFGMTYYYVTGSISARNISYDYDKNTSSNFCYFIDLQRVLIKLLWQKANKEANGLYAELLPRADEMRASGRCADNVRMTCTLPDDVWMTCRQHPDNICCPPVKFCLKSYSRVVRMSSVHRLHKILIPKKFPVK